MNASVLFLDICGFSKRASETVEQQVHILQAMTLLFSEFIAIIEDHGGAVEKNTGDGLMAYFVGAPAGGLTHQSRAVDTALYMFYAKEIAVDPILLRAGFPPFPIRITIDSGDVLFAEVGLSRGFRGIVAIGTTANIASKMLGDAKSGELLLGFAAVASLRADWLQFVRFHSNAENFVFSGTGEPYSRYLYFGRFW